MIWIKAIVRGIAYSVASNVQTSLLRRAAFRGKQMSFKTIMCIVGMKVGDNDLKSAIDLCAENNAHLSVLVISFASPPPIGDYASTISDAWLEERQQDLQQLEKRTATINTLLSEAGISASISSEYAEFVWAAGEIGRHARYSDLIFIGPEVLKSDKLKSKVVEGALFESGRPVLIAPSGATPTLTPRHVLLAWDSRVEFARAAREALEMLINAEDVHVTLVDPDASSTMNGPEPGADVGYLFGAPRGERHRGQAAERWQSGCGCSQSARRRHRS